MAKKSKKKTGAKEEERGGIVICSGEFYDEIEDFSKLFEHKQKLREAARFAMAIGIRKGIRIEREEWPKKRKPRTIAHLFGQFDDQGRYDFKLLFETLDILDHKVPLNLLLSEYITGGMQWIKDNQLKDRINFSKMKDEFPDIFSEPK